MSPVQCLQSVVLSHFGPSDRPHSSNTLLLQNMGNEARNVFGEDFWVDQVLPEPTPAPFA